MYIYIILSLSIYIYIYLCIEHYTPNFIYLTFDACVWKWGIAHTSIRVQGDQAGRQGQQTGGEDHLAVRLFF